jgi:hypothetical protein
MPRYIVERHFATGLRIPQTEAGADACLNVVRNNAAQGVTWLQSYVSLDLQKTFCVYDGPSPEAVRKVAGSNELPVGAITEVRVLDPYFYRS